MTLACAVLLSPHDHGGAVVLFHEVPGNLAGWKAFETVAVTDVNNRLPLCFRQLVDGLGSISIFAIIRHHVITFYPALDGSF